MVRSTSHQTKLLHIPSSLTFLCCIWPVQGYRSLWEDALHSNGDQPQILALGDHWLPLWDGDPLFQVMNIGTSKLGALSTWLLVSAGQRMDLPTSDNLGLFALWGILAAPGGENHQCTPMPVDAHIAFFFNVSLFLGSNISFSFITGEQSSPWGKGTPYIKYYSSQWGVFP